MARHWSCQLVRYGGKRDEVDLSSKQVIALSLTPLPERSAPVPSRYHVHPGVVPRPVFQRCLDICDSCFSLRLARDVQVRRP